MKSPLVLCVDDDHAIRDLYKAAFATRGHTVIAANDGHHALRVLQDKLQEIDAVIVDYDMPGMNGFELAVRVKYVAPQIPILMVSGFHPELTAMTPYVNAAIGKGVPIMNIVGCLESLLDKVSNENQTLSA